jgi:hypothetical protein
VAAARAPPRTGSSDVIDLARRFSCHIWALHKTLEWLAKFKAKYGQLKTAYPARLPVGRLANSSPAVRELRSPYIKLESSVKPHRPLYAELKDYPELYLEGKSGSSPFCGPQSKNRRKKLVKRLDLDRRPERGETPVVAAPKKLCHKKKQGFCEICALSFSDLEGHLVSETHTSFVRTASNWAKVDNSSLFRSDHPLLR